MNAWLITVGEPLPGFSKNDRSWRCGYLAQLLASRGHRVIWWTSAFDHFRRVHFVPDSRRVEVGENLALQFLQGRAYRRNVSIARQINHVQIARDFRKLAATCPRPDVVVCSFPTIELSREAVAFGRAHDVPTYLDIRDLWPDEMIDRLPASLRLLGRLALQPLSASTRQAMQGATGLIGISQRFLEWGLAFAGRDRQPDRDRVFPLGYTGSLGSALVGEGVRAAMSARGVREEKKIFWFSGTFVGNIDLGTVIETARRLQGRDDIQFVLTGAGEREQEWRDQGRGLVNLVFTGWAGSAELAYLSSVAWAGLAAYRVGAKMTLPNKVFEYMSRGLPVLISLEGETRDMVSANGVGLPFTAGDPDSLAQVVLHMADAPTERERMSASATRLFEERFAPQVIYEEYADFITSGARPRSTSL
jgi:glycosyltransferase involved in cell wall biosynthesis